MPQGKKGLYLAQSLFFVHILVPSCQCLAPEVKIVRVYITHGLPLRLDFTAQPFPGILND